MNLDYDGTEKFDLKQFQKRVEKKIRERFGTVLAKDETLDSNFRCFIANEPDEKIYEAGEMDGIPTILVYSKTGELTKIDVNSVEGEEVSYEKNVNPLVEKLLK